MVSSLSATSFQRRNTKRSSKQISGQSTYLRSLEIILVEPLFQSSLSSPLDKNFLTYPFSEFPLDKYWRHHKTGKMFAALKYHSTDYLYEV